MVETTTAAIASAIEDEVSKLKSNTCLKPTHSITVAMIELDSAASHRTETGITIAA